MSFLVLILIFVPAFIAGLGVISPYWIGASAIIAYGKSILAVSDQSGVDDFRKTATGEFMRLEGRIKLKVLRYALLIALSYGVGYLFSYLP